MTYAVIGASGFIGQHLVSHLVETTSAEVIAVSRRASGTGSHPRVTWRAADLADAASLTAALADADVVINLAWPAGPPSWSEDLARAVLAGKGRCLVHCSTAVVVGAAAEPTITERTVPLPRTPYEHVKLGVEERLANALKGRASLTIARPAVVFGRGGQNLVSLAHSLRSGGVAAITARRMLFGRRPMHLVPVETVARAMAFLAARRPAPDAAAIYQIAADADPENHYRAVEARLARGMGLDLPSWPPVTLPSAALTLALRLRGRSDTSSRRRYSSEALEAAGFTGGIPVGDAVEAFGRSLAGEDAL